MGRRNWQQVELTSKRFVVSTDPRRQMFALLAGMWPVKTLATIDRSATVDTGRVFRGVGRYFVRQAACHLPPGPNIESCLIAGFVGCGHWVPFGHDVWFLFSISKVTRAVMNAGPARQ